MATIYTVSFCRQASGRQHIATAKTMKGALASAMLRRVENFSTTEITDVIGLYKEAHVPFVRTPRCRTCNIIRKSAVMSLEIRKIIRKVTKR